MGNFLERQADHQMDSVKKNVLLMAGCVEQALDLAMQGLSQSSVEAFNAVAELEKRVNETHILVDELCAQYLAMQQPVAKDLRFVISFIKMNTDLERMGDQCMNISYTGKDYLGRKEKLPPAVQPLKIIQEMGVLVRQMVKDSLDAFVREDLEKAKTVLMTDDEVDKRKEKVFKDFTGLMKTNPEIVEAALDVIMIARSLERLGDHATNIAEDVIYVSTGKDIRHGRGS